MGGSLTTWLKELKSGVSSGNMTELLRCGRNGFSGFWLTVTSRWPLGVNVLSKEWDLLIVLDACRVDAMKAVKSEYNFITDVSSIWSVGSSSHEWYAKTFDRQYADRLSETALISGNPNAESFLRHSEMPPRYTTPFAAPDWDAVRGDELAYVEYLSRHQRPYQSTSVAPSYVTDRAIVAARRGYENVMVHYFQPHRPYMYNMVTNGGELTYAEDQPHDAAREGKATKSEIWDLYLDNLRLVLDSVEVLLSNADTENVAITADHGELFGELGQFGHPESIPHPKLKKVPWVETTASDEQTRHPDEEFALIEGYDVEETLTNLGYIDP